MQQQGPLAQKNNSLLRAVLEIFTTVIQLQVDQD